MFSKKEPSNTEKVMKEGVPSIIAQSLNILGNLVSEGAIEVEGAVNGNVQCVMLTIHKNGHINGDIAAETVFISGKVEGTIKARNVRLSEHSHVEGTIIYEMLSVEDGAFINGECRNIEKAYIGDLDETLQEDEETIKKEESGEEIRLVADNGLVSF